MKAEVMPSAGSVGRTVLREQLSTPSRLPILFTPPDPPNPASTGAASLGFREESTRQRSMRYKTWIVNQKLGVAGWSESGRPAVAPSVLRLPPLILPMLFYFSPAFAELRHPTTDLVDHPQKVTDTHAHTHIFYCFIIKLCWFLVDSRRVDEDEETGADAHFRFGRQRDEEPAKQRSCEGGDEECTGRASRWMCLFRKSVRNV